MTKQIALTRGKVATVDDEDFEILSVYQWYAETRHGVWYARTGSTIDGKSRPLMHKLIMGSKQVDHADRNGLNNTRNNLRYCTSSLNNANRKKQAGTSSNYKGVSLEHGHYWRVTIHKDKKKINRGEYKTDIDAALAYN